MTVKIGEPYYAGDLVVFFIDENEAVVTDYDCRYELRATDSTCECCTFRFRSRSNPNFACRHIEAVRRMQARMNEG